jgi:RecA/RadA recombinase
MAPKKTTKDDVVPAFPWRVDPKTDKPKAPPKAAQTRLTEIRKKLQKDHKGVIVRPARDSAPPWVLFRRPTGLPSLDQACGGGFPPGGTTQIIGAPSIGKTTLVLTHLGLHQRIHGEDSRIFLAMTEGELDKDYARKLGFYIALNDDELEAKEVKFGRKLTDDERREYTYEVGHIELLKAGEKGYTPELQDAVVDLVLTGEFQTGLIDSLGAAANEDQIEKPSAARHPGGGSARTNTQFSSKLARAFLLEHEEGRMNETTVIMINQLRQDIGSNKKFMGSRVPAKHSGGYALLHGHLLNLELWKGPFAKLKKKVDGKDVEIKVGYTVYWEIAKGKCSCHEGIRGSYVYHYANKRSPFPVGPDLCLDAVQQGLGTTVSDTGHPKFTDSKGEVHKANSVQNLATKLDLNGLYWDIYHANAKALDFRTRLK